MDLNRRNLLQRVGLGSLGSFWLLSKLAAARPGASIYQQLGVRPVINCMGAWTVIGASRQWPELHAPTAEASRQFVFLEELQEKIGERLSKLIGSEAATITIAESRASGEFIPPDAKPISNLPCNVTTALPSIQKGGTRLRGDCGRKNGLPNLD